LIQIGLRNLSGVVGLDAHEINSSFERILIDEDISGNAIVLVVIKKPT